MRRGGDVGYVMVPLVVLMIGTGLVYQARQQASMVQGAGDVGIADQRAQLLALQAEVFAAACLDAARRNPGAVAATLPVLLPAGVLGIDGARCSTTQADAGRMVYAGVPSVPGAAAVLMDVLRRSAFWSRVSTPGQASAMVSGQQVSVPATYAAGTLLYQMRITP